MRICRFNNGRFGVVTGDVVHDVTDAVIEGLGHHAYPLPRHDLLIDALPHLAPRLAAAAASAPGVPLSSVRLLSPIANPGKIIAAPVNYKKHLDEAIADPAIHHQNQIGEIQRVGLFLKANSSVVGPSEGVEIRFPERRNDHEIELAAVIGRRASHVSREDALDIVAGYCIGLDMTVRGPEERSLRKSCDSYTVLGPWFVTADEVGDPHDLDLRLTVNEAVRQSANTRDLVLDLRDLIVFASRFYTLEVGDVLLTGTPEGVGPVVAGDVIAAEIARVGQMTVAVR